MKIIKILIHKNKKLLFLFFIQCFFFGVLVFNEILILNFWTLQYNTKKYISKRELIEREIRNSLCSNDSEDIEDNDIN